MCYSIDLVQQQLPTQIKSRGGQPKGKGQQEASSPSVLPTTALIGPSAGFAALRNRRIAKQRPASTDNITNPPVSRKRSYSGKKSIQADGIPGSGQVDSVILIRMANFLKIVL